MVARRSRTVVVRACAKLNLTLRVLGIRPDGYHELRTTFQSLQLHDTLTVTPTAGPFGIDCRDPQCPRDHRNLAWQAATRLWDEWGGRGAAPAVRIHIVKRIPMQAGLGGGSADAAAALVALAAAWRLEVGVEQLARIGAALGADVPFFFHGGTALGVERGDLVFRLPDCPPSWVVLVRPSFGVSTGDAYGWWDASAPSSSRRHRLPGQDCKGWLPLPAGEWTNDLEAPVVAHHPQIGVLLGRLRRAGALYSAMSGSGSAVFGLFPTREQAAAAAASIASPALAAMVTRTIGREAYQRLTAPQRRSLPGNRPIG